MKKTSLTLSILLLFAGGCSTELDTELDRCIEANKYSSDNLSKALVYRWQIEDIREHEAGTGFVGDEYYEDSLKRLIKEATKHCNEQGIY